MPRRNETELDKKTKEKHDNTQQEYDETKYANIVGKIKDEQILEGVGFDEDQAVLIGDRIKKVCPEGFW